MGCIIIAMPQLDDASRLAGILRSKGLDVRYVCDTAAQVLVYAGEADSGVVVCGFRLKDMPHMELADMLPENFEMILTVGSANWDNCREGIIKIPLPFKVSELTRSIEMVLSQTDARLRKGGKGPGGRSPAQQAIVENAQKYLMERFGMERVEAYRYMQKQSMNSGNSMVDVAKTILESNYVG